MRAFLALIALLVLATVAFAHDECAVGGELRRNHHCVAVRHTKKDACCWMKRDGTHGKLPYGCCGTGWKTHDCESIINNVCETHPDDM
mmetsp:Transcript_45529/g.140377  ORF Transcript_45529/g.140377 Transcript_45529/m.140377 type:complete len:88 (+) Transcript_45529:40-303(+)